MLTPTCYALYLGYNVPLAAATLARETILDARERIFGYFLFHNF